jgi:hypothetical protein
MEFYVSAWDKTTIPPGVRINADVRVFGAYRDVLKKLDDGTIRLVRFISAFEIEVVQSSPECFAKTSRPIRTREVICPVEWS